MKHASTRELFAYWNRLRGARLAPERSEIDPAVIRRALGDAFILDVEDADFSFRLAGTRVCALAGRELKGAAFPNLWRSQDRTMLTDMVLSAIEEPAVFVAGARTHAPHREALDLEVMVLPLRHRGHPQRRAIGVIAPLATPFWLGMDPVGPFELGPVRLTRPDADRHWPSLERTIAGTPLRIGHLAVIEGGISRVSRGR